MRSLACVVVAATLLLACPALAAPATPATQSERPDVTLPLEGVVTNPDWLQRPTGEEMANYYPPVAQMMGLEGRATITCEVLNSGSVGNCKVDQETPAGMGFGDAAIALSKYFVMKPKTVDGVAVAGAKVTVPIGFGYPWDTLGADADSAPQATPPSAKALELARRIASLSFDPERMQSYMDESRKWIGQRFANVSLTEQEQAALDDYIEAIGASAAARTEAAAARYARLFSEKQLAQADAFFQSPTGRAWLALSADDAAEYADNRRLSVAMRDEARKRFCDKFDCLKNRIAAPPPTPAK
jgi:TonB family protein